MTKVTEMYKYSQSTGKLQVWSAWADGVEVVRSFGEVDGAMQEPRYTAEARSVGASNETTPSEQAQIEVDALYLERHKNKHYRDTVYAAQMMAATCKEPRKIHKFGDHGDKLPNLIYVSVKEDGSRACILEGNVFSKIGLTEKIKVKHLREALEKLGKVDFDSEIYAPELPLQRIRSAWLKPVRTDKEVIKVANDHCKRIGSPKAKSLEEAIDILGYNPNDDAALLKFNIFDIPVTGIPFHERIELMGILEKGIKELGLEDNFVFLYPKLMNREEARTWHDELILLGHEGVVYYDPKDMYKFGVRSYTCQKAKDRLDAETLVVGVEMCKNGDGKLITEASLVLGNVKFKVMMKVKRRDGLSYPRDFNTMEALIGKWITFSYEALSSAGIPAKPVGEVVRKCDAQGVPQE